MSVADEQVSISIPPSPNPTHRASAIALFCILAVYTLSTCDDLPVQRHVMAVVTLGFAAFYFTVTLRQRLRFSVPAACLLAMVCYGAAQTLWSSYKIVYDGWMTTIFWFCGGLIALVATQIFADREISTEFRRAFIFFGSGICLLEILEQASHASKYFWLIPSRFEAPLFGPFAYYNNFAQFVEILLPVTLWTAIGQRGPRLLYLTLGALQVGSVVASTSRAGTALVLLELIGVLVLAYFKKGRTRILPALSIALVLTAVFVYVAGFQGVANKFERQNQLGARGDINKSSIAMIEQHPLVGWGLGTYVPVYRMFARYDDGTWVNRAHNDWLEWTAEGGIFFSGLMLVIFLWSIAPAVRSGWGIGLLAVCLHATVDYPFARMGVCAWYFALIGMLAVRGNDREPHRRRRKRKSVSQEAVPAS